MLELIDLNKKISKSTYKEIFPELELQLGQVQRAARAAGVPVVVVLEGWDAAGKGTIINRLTQALDPRGFKVHPISAPNDVERYHPWMRRFATALPAKGTFAIFDRSWYGRLLVERVEGFCTEDEWQRAYREINEFERQLSNFGTVMLKFWLHIDQDEQLRRFKDRQNTADKHWKITDEDWRNREKWNRYEVAVNEMLGRTSTTYAPWTILEANCKLHARIKALKTVIAAQERALKAKEG